MLLVSRQVDTEMLMVLQYKFDERVKEAWEPFSKVLGLKIVTNRKSTISITGIIPMRKSSREPPSLSHLLKILLKV